MSEPALRPEPADAGLRDTVRRDLPAPAVAAADDVRAGVLVADRYRLVERIGKGGMAEVWRAVHEELRTEVAIKFLAKELAGHPDLAPLALARFRFEAQVSARLSGRTRHVVSVHDAGSHKGTPYLAMELIRGHDLEQEVTARGPLDPSRVATLLDQVADALDTAHSMGIVHRDIKPSNLLLTEGDRGAGEGLFVKLADFGVAKATQAGAAFDLPRVTAAGMLVGSPAFMSPEQADGRSDLAGTSDIWSLGTVVYEILTGRACFEGDTLTAVLVSVAGRKFVPLSKVRPALGKGVDAWLDRCLAVDPSRRFQTVAEMSRAFREALPRGPETAPGAATGPAQAGGGARKASLAVGALVAVTALAALVYVLFGGPSGATPQPLTATATASAPPPASTSTPDPSSPGPSVTPTLPADPAPSASAHTEPSGPTGHATGSLSTKGPPPGSTTDTPAATAPPVASVPVTATVPASSPRATGPTPAPSPNLPPKTISPSEIH